MKATNGDDNTEEQVQHHGRPRRHRRCHLPVDERRGLRRHHRHRVPVTWPQGLNLKEGDFWSGSPYLGNSGMLEPGHPHQDAVRRVLPRRPQPRPDSGHQLRHHLRRHVDPHQGRASQAKSRATKSATSTCRFATDGDGNDERDDHPDNTSLSAGRHSHGYQEQQEAAGCSCHRDRRPGRRRGGGPRRHLRQPTSWRPVPTVRRAFPTIAPTTCLSGTGTVADPCLITLDAGTGTVTVADAVNGAQTVPFFGFGVNGAAEARWPDRRTRRSRCHREHVMKITLTQTRRHRSDRPVVPEPSGRRCQSTTVTARTP